MYFSFNFLVSLNTDIFSLMYGEGFSCPIPFICLFNLKIDSSWAMAIKLDFIISRQSLKKYYHIYQHIFCMVRRTHYNNCNTAGFAKCNFSWLIVSTCIHVLFCILLENISFIQHCRRRAAKFWPLLRRLWPLSREVSLPCHTCCRWNIHHCNCA